VEGVSGSPVIGGRNKHFPSGRPIDLAEGIKDHDLDTRVRARSRVRQKPVGPSPCSDDERLPLVLRNVLGMRPPDARQVGPALAAGVQGEQEVTSGVAKPLELAKARHKLWCAGDR
jgi:hypothetical protein